MKFLIVFLLFISCDSKEKKEYAQVSESSFNKVNPRDTVITYNIEEISLEGTEAVVTYRNKKIYKSKINIYGETGQVELIYKFFPANIEVTENSYRYKEDLKNVNSKDDLILSNTAKYYIDDTGKILSNKPKEYIDIFKEFKSSVPFEL